MQIENIIYLLCSKNIFAEYNNINYKDKGYIDMYIIKYIILFTVFILSALIGKIFSRKYIDRLQELEEMKNFLNVFKSKIKFMYEPIPEIFNEIAINSKTSISYIFKLATIKMKTVNADLAWQESVEESKNNLTQEDKDVIKMLSKLLGQTDVEGQISQIDITQNFLDSQIKEAQEEKQKNEKLYIRLGTTIGLAIVIILV